MNDFGGFGRVLVHDFCSKLNDFGGFGSLSTTNFVRNSMFLEGFGRMVEAVPAQAVEAAGSGVAVHYSVTTLARGGKKRMKCVINCSILFPTVHGCRRRTVFVKMYCDISSPSRLTRRSPAYRTVPPPNAPTISHGHGPLQGLPPRNAPATELCRALRRVCGRRGCKL